MLNQSLRTAAVAISLLGISAFAQDSVPTPPPSGQDQTQSQPDPAQQSSAPADPQQPGTIPPKLTIKPGTYITVRLNEFLSSDRSMVGDAFTATLTQPIVVDGVVVAARGQSVTGRVTEAKKAGRVSGTSRLGIQLIDLPVVDGQHMSIESQLLTRNGTTSTGRDAAAIAGTTAAGAAVGAAVNGGVGAGVGAGAGLVVGVIGVLLTRGNPTIVYPETMLTFRIEQPVTISTEHTVQAFHFVQPSDYQQSAPHLVRRAGPPPPPPPPYYYRPYPYPYPYPYYWGPGFYGPGVVIYRRW